MAGVFSNMRVFVMLAAVGLTLLVAGCRDEEQGRPLSFEKGVYGGVADQQISKETRKQLQDRVRLQNFN